jgi:hypothetical protein
MAEQSLYERLGGMFAMPEREKGEALAAFNAQKADVTAGSKSAAER